MHSTFLKNTLSLPLCLALCLGQGISSPAIAATPAEEGEGSLFLAQYKKGMRLVQRQQWEDAVEAFQSAYDARSKPHPELLLYIAKAYLKLNQGGPALKFYAQFVAASPSPTEAQRHEVKTGMARAQAMLESQPARSAKSPVVNSDDDSGTDSGRTSAAAQKKESSTPQKSDSEPESDKPASATESPAPPAAKTVRAVITGRKANIPYTVSVGSGERLCTAPCEMQVPSGPTTVTVSGPGEKQFQRQVSLPGVPFKMTVQHFTLSRAIAGPILLLLSGAFLGGALPLTLTGGSSSGGALGGAIPLYLHAGVFFFVGLGQLAAIKRNSIDIQPLAGPLAARPFPLRLANLSVAPSENGKGAVASVGFRF
jgi:hypothetical protein